METWNDCWELEHSVLLSTPTLRSSGVAKWSLPYPSAWRQTSPPPPALRCMTWCWRQVSLPCTRLWRSSWWWTPADPEVKPAIPAPCGWLAVSLTLALPVLTSWRCQQLTLAPKTSSEKSPALPQSRSSAPDLPAPVQEVTDPIWGNSSSVHENTSLNVIVEWLYVALLVWRLSAWRPATPYDDFHSVSRFLNANAD